MLDTHLTEAQKRQDAELERFIRFRELFTQGRNRKLTPDERREIRKLSAAIVRFLTQ